MAATKQQLEKAYDVLETAFSTAAEAVMDRIKSGAIPPKFSKVHNLWYYVLPWDEEPLETLDAFAGRPGFDEMLCDALCNAAPRSMEVFETDENERLVSIRFHYGTKWNEWPPGITPY